MGSSSSSDSLFVSGNTQGALNALEKLDNSIKRKREQQDEGDEMRQSEPWPGPYSPYQNPGAGGNADRPREASYHGRGGVLAVSHITQSPFLHQHRVCALLTQFIVGWWEFPLGAVHICR